MKLTNPIDAKLNSVFAEKIAGLDIHTPRKWLSGDGVTRVTAPAHIPSFVSSIETVLPWLEKSGWFAAISHKDEWGEKGYVISIWENSEDGKILADHHEDVSLARGLTIQLLRANGVEIEFTKEIA